MSKINLRQTSCEICSLFEALLNEHGIDIPNKDRQGEPTEARIYGNDYYDLEDQVTDIIFNLAKAIKGNDIDFETRSMNYTKIVKGVYYLEDLNNTPKATN